MPSFAERNWIRMAIAFDHSNTQSSRYPNLEPARMFVAKLPGSMYAMEAMKAGPKKLHRPPRPNQRGCAASIGSAGAVSWVTVRVGEEVGIEVAPSLKL